MVSDTDNSIYPKGHIMTSRGICCMMPNSGPEEHFFYIHAKTATTATT